YGRPGTSRRALASPSFAGTAARAAAVSTVEASGVRPISAAKSYMVREPRGGSPRALAAHSGAHARSLRHLPSKRARSARRFTISSEQLDGARAPKPTISTERHSIRIDHAHFIYSYPL